MGAHGCGSPLAEKGPCLRRTECQSKTRVCSEERCCYPLQLSCGVLDFPVCSEPAEVEISGIIGSEVNLFFGVEIWLYELKHSANEE